MADVPAPITWGTIVGNFGALYADGPDAGPAPDLEPVSGTVTITPRLGIVKILSIPLTAIAMTVQCQIIDGVLIGPDGTPGVRVVATDTPGIEPYPLQWEVRIQINGARVQPAPAVIDVPSNTVVDLTLVLPAQATVPIVEVVTTQTKIDAEAARDAAISARNTAVSASEAAVSARQLAESARDTAVTSSVTSVNASASAVSASTSAQAAKTAAETARTQAQTANTTAQTSATNASTSASAAAASATSASTSASTATTSASNASTSASAAAASATSATTSASNASSSASAAAASSTTANTHRAAASAAQTAAETARDTAVTSAQTASNASVSASASSVSALNSAVSANNAAQRAESAAGASAGVPTGGTVADYLRGDTTWRPLNKAAVGLTNVDNTSDLSKPISTLTQTALDGKSATTHGHALTDTNITGILPWAQMPVPVILPNTAHNLDDYVTSGAYHQNSNTGASASTNYPFASAGLLRVWSVLSTNPTFVYQSYYTHATNRFFWRVKYSTWSAWKEVQDIASLTKATVGLSNVDNTSDVDKPISTATQTALNGKAPTVHGHVLTDANITGILTVAKGGTGRATSTTAFGTLVAGTTATGAHQTVAPGVDGNVLVSRGPSATPNYRALTKDDVGLTNVDNTSDINKPISTATQAALNLKVSQRSKEAVFIGSSNSLPTTWTGTVSAALGLTERNFAIGGAAISNGNFLTQLTSARDSTAFANADVGYVFITDCSNDIRANNDAGTGSTSVLAASATLFSFARTNFPNARIIVVPVIWPAHPQSQTFNVPGGYQVIWHRALGLAVDALRGRAQEYQCEFIEDSWTWVTGHNEWMESSGGVHPNAAGYAQIAQWVLKFLRGEPTTAKATWTTVSPKAPQYNTTTPGAGIRPLLVNRDGWDVYIEGGVLTTSATGTSWDWFTVPPGFTPTYSVEIIARTSSGMTPIPVTIFPNGTGRVNTTDLPANTLLLVSGNWTIG